MNVEIVDKMGTDLSVVNAARVSFSKKSQWKRNIPTLNSYELSEKDDKLIKYLAKHGHWSPFAHAFLSFRIKAPIFVARQLVKHQVGLAWNEVSRRYVDDKPEFYIPFMWRKRPEESIKQGSSDEEVPYDITKIINDAEEMYNDMLTNDIAPEMARMILPQCMMTEWIWSGSVFAFSRVCNLRNKENAQSETRMVTLELSKHMKDHFPICSKYLSDI
jgi:thymidylate synthase (FAD)